MSRQLLLHQLRFPLAMLAARSRFRRLLVQTQRGVKLVPFRGEQHLLPETNAQTAAKPTGKDSASTPAAKATLPSDPNVTTAHLKLFVKPLTVAELEVEAKGWQNLLKTNVENNYNAAPAHRTNHRTNCQAKRIECHDRSPANSHHLPPRKRPLTPQAAEVATDEQQCERRRCRHPPPPPQPPHRPKPLLPTKPKLLVPQGTEASANGSATRFIAGS